MKRPMDQRLARERVVYDYLEALENNDLDGLSEALHQAEYDAALDQMLVDAHHAYFQNEQVEQSKSAETDTRADVPAIIPLVPQGLRRGQRKEGHHLSSWARALVAVLIASILIGSTVLALYYAGHRTQVVSPPEKNSTPSPAVCKPLPWRMDSITNGMEGILNGVAASSAVDAWAVGTQIIQDKSNVPPFQYPVIEHWNGEKWSKANSPQLNGKEGVLQAIALVSPNDIWAAGAQYKREPGTTPSSAPTYSEVTTLIEHWDGRNWTLVASPSDPMSVHSIVVISADDIWIVGELFSKNQRTTRLEHWNGQQWTSVQDKSGVLEDGTSSNAVGFLTATAADGQVLAGGTRMGSDQVYHAYLERWDGQQWQQVDVSALGQDATAIESLSAVSANDIWMLVQYPDTNQGTGTTNRIMHWDGTTWTQAQVSQPGVWSDNTRILALSSTNVWALRINPPSLVHWNGQSWTPVSLALDKQGQLIPYDFAVSTGGIWVVGVAIENDGHRGYFFQEQQITCS